MYDTPVGNIYEWYRGHGYDGREYLVTVWDNGTAWIQLRDTSADSFGRPITVQAVGPSSTPKDAA